VNTVFVYGLLKPGFSLHHHVEPFIVRSSPAHVRGRLYDAGVPAARFDEEGEVEGVLLWIDDERVHELLRTLDELEDEGLEYKRVVVDAATPGGVVPAFAYEYIGRPGGSTYAGRSWAKPQL
jgi:gamma-glutamylcyclotransferase (GGCT)/AIG2-like uncharacterized protein YtfP